MHILNDPSFFLTNKTGAPQGEELGLMNPLSESSCNCSDSSFIFILQFWTISFEVSWCSTLKTTIPFGSRPIALLSVSNICCTCGTSGCTGQVPYLVALVAPLGARAIVVKMALVALGQGSPIRLPFACPHVVNFGNILPLEGLLLVTMVVSE
ncbi:hypothetical protein Tco_0035685 [Tanacetum coccineum]